MPDHEYFTQVTGERFTEALIDSIEKEADEDTPAMDALEVSILLIAVQFKKHPEAATVASVVILAIGFSCFGCWAVICMTCAGLR